MADPPVEFCHEEWSSLLTQQLEFLRQSNRFCDVIIRTAEGSSLLAHGNVLAASSPMLSTLLQKSMMVDISGIDTSTWNRILGFIYHGKVVLPGSQLLVLESAAEVLGLTTLLRLIRRIHPRGADGNGIKQEQQQPPQPLCVVQSPISFGKVRLCRLESPMIEMVNTETETPTHLTHDATLVDQSQQQDSQASETSEVPDCGDLSSEYSTVAQNVTENSIKQSASVIGTVIAAPKESDTIKGGTDDKNNNSRVKSASQKPKQSIQSRKRELSLRNRRRTSSSLAGSYDEFIGVKDCFVDLTSQSSAGSTSSLDEQWPKVKPCFVDLSPKNEKNREIFTYQQEMTLNKRVRLTLVSKINEKILSSEAEKSESSPMSAGKPVQTSFTCVPCQEEFESKKGLYVHFDKQHRFNCCGQCAVSFKSKTALMLHWQEKPRHEKYRQNPFKLITLGDCMRLVRQRPKANSYIKRTRRCLLCKKARSMCICSSKSQTLSVSSDPDLGALSDLSNNATLSLKKFDRTHHGSKKWQCRNCSLVFLTARQLQLHENSHQSKGYQCKFCKKVYSHKRSLERHIEVLHSIRCVRCRLCRHKAMDLLEIRNHLAKKHKLMGKKQRGQYTFLDKKRSRTWRNRGEDTAKQRSSSVESHDTMKQKAASQKSSAVKKKVENKDHRVKKKKQESNITPVRRRSRSPSVDLERKNVGSEKKKSEDTTVQKKGKNGKEDTNEKVDPVQAVLNSLPILQQIQSVQIPPMPSRPVYCCNQCTKQYLRRYSLKVHMKNMHGIELENRRRSRSQSTEDILQDLPLKRKRKRKSDEGLVVDSIDLTLDGEVDEDEKEVKGKKKKQRQKNSIYVPSAGVTEYPGIVSSEVILERIDDVDVGAFIRESSQETDHGINGAKIQDEAISGQNESQKRNDDQSSEANKGEVCSEEVVSNGLETADTSLAISHGVDNEKGDRTEHEDVELENGGEHVPMENEGSQTMNTVDSAVNQEHEHQEAKRTTMFDDEASNSGVSHIVDQLLEACGLTPPPPVKLTMKRRSKRISAQSDKSAGDDSEGPEIIASSSPEGDSRSRRELKPKNLLGSILKEGSEELESSSDCSVVIPISNAVSSTSDAVVIIHSPNHWQQDDIEKEEVAAERGNVVDNGGMDNQNIEAQSLEEEEAVDRETGSMNGDIVIIRQIQNDVNEDEEATCSAEEGMMVEGQEFVNDAVQNLDEVANNDITDLTSETSMFVVKDLPLKGDAMEAVMQDCGDGTILCVVAEQSD